MSGRYRIPEALAELRRWLDKHHAAADFATERQAAFMAQQLAGTRFKFPAPGKSCLTVLQAIERAVIDENTAGKMSATADKSKSRRKGRGKPAHPVPAKPHAVPDVSTGLVIFCDGACEPNPGAGGWGFVVYRDGIEIHADCGGADPATNQTMELTAAIRALEWASVHIYGPDEVPDRFQLISDSQYVVKGCNEWRHGWKTRGWRRGKPNGKGPGGEVANLELWKDLDRLLCAAPVDTVTIAWCKGHAGIIGNERADELALIGRERAMEAVDPLTAEFRAIMSGEAA